MFRAFISISTLSFVLTFIVPMASSAYGLTPEKAAALYSSSDEGFQEIMELYKITKASESIKILNYEARVQPSSGYMMETYQLKVNGLQPFRLHVRHPQKEKSQKARPVIFVAAGAESNINTLDLFPRADNVIFVVFEYSLEKRDQLKMFSEIPEAIQEASAQMNAALRWVSQQSWADASHINAVGISLGTVFLPLSLRVSEQQGLDIESTVLAYGGAGMVQLVEKELRKMMGSNETKIALKILKPVMEFLDPTLHISSLKGRFLIIYGEEDEIFPKESIETLIELTPEPKKVVGLPGGHINSDKWEIIDRLGNEMLIWFKEIVQKVPAPKW